MLDISMDYCGWHKSISEIKLVELMSNIIPKKQFIELR